MILENRISIYDFVQTISELVDLVSPLLNNHHKKVTHIAYNLARIMGLSNDEIQDIVLASMMHDIGAFSLDTRLSAQSLEPYGVDVTQHALIGCKLLKNFEPLAKAADLIKNHHTDFDEAGYSAPLSSYIIHLADRAAVLIDDDREVLSQIPEMFEVISHNRSMFHPDTVSALMKLLNLEYVWIETFTAAFDDSIMKRVKFTNEIVDIETLQSFAKFVAKIIDFRCRFTATHSSGVAAVARELTAITGFSERECKQMEIAGLLHDLGKLSVPSNILEKKGPLDDNEIYVVKKHTYYTYNIVSRINGLEQIATWAAYHHERQDGNGYPFHVHGNEFPMLARVMAVADIMTALAEDRPYRRGMNKKESMKILYNMSVNGGVDKSITQVADKYFHRINNARINAQFKALKEYESFDIH